jgi:hypothetical protein
VSLALESGAQAASVTISTFSNSAEATDPRADAVFGEGTPAPSVEPLVVSPPNRIFQKNGVTLTFSDPQKDETSAVSRSNSTLGTCLGGSRVSASVAVCGNAPGQPPQLNSIQLSFDKSVKLISSSGILRGPSGTTSALLSSWETDGSSEAFEYSFVSEPNGGGLIQQNYMSPFTTNFIALAGTPVFIASDFEGELDYWMQSIEFEAISSDVPGPLPILGAASAFAWSRRARRRIKAVKTSEFN